MLDRLQWVSNKVHAIKFRLHCFELRAYHTSCQYVPMPRYLYQIPSVLNWEAFYTSCQYVAMSKYPYQIQGQTQIPSMKIKNTGNKVQIAFFWIESIPVWAALVLGLYLGLYLHFVLYLCSPHFNAADILFVFSTDILSSSTDEHFNFMLNIWK